MTAPHQLPDMTARMDRITARQREANIAAEGQPVNVYTDPRVADEVAWYENYRTAKTVLQSPDWYGADVIHAARDFIHEYEREIPKQKPGHQKFLDGYNPDRKRPSDMGLGAIVLGIILAFLAAACLHAWAVLL
jgi:hypothetical protein